MEINYKNYTIDVYFTYDNLITVFYNGDDIIFKTIEEAKIFIDEITK